MKKIFVIAALAALTTTSCKKDYTCKCMDKDGQETITYTAEMKKADADSWCDTWHSGVSPSGGKCELQ